jgi:plastocyanin domain-containing protein
MGTISEERIWIGKTSLSLSKRKAHLLLQQISWNTCIVLDLLTLSIVWTFLSTRKNVSRSRRVGRCIKIKPE